MIESSQKSRLSWFKYRWLTGLFGLALMITGQTWLAIDTLPSRPALKLGNWLTREIHLAIPSIDNVLYGLPLLLAGGVLLGMALRHIPLLPVERDFNADQPFEPRKLSRAWPWLTIGGGLFITLLLRLNVEGFYPFQAPMLIASLLMVAIAFAAWDRRRGIHLSPQVSRQDLLWMLLVVTAGLVTGTYRLQGMPDGLIGDEGNFWGIAKAIATGEFEPSVFAVGVYTFPVFSSILPAWFIRIFGVSLWGWRLSSVLTGLLTVPPLYLLARELFNRKTAIAASFVLIASPYFMAFSRLGYNNIQALFVTTLALYWLYLGLKRKSSLYLYLAGCAAGLGFYVYFAARMAVVIALLFILSVWIGRKIKFREAGFATGMLLAGFFLLTIPHYVYGLSHDPIALSYKTFESLFFNTFNGLQFYPEEELYAVAPPFEINGNQLFYHPRIYLELLARGFIRSMLAFQKPWLISEHYIAFPLAGSMGALFYAAGLGWALLAARQPRSQLILLWFFVNALGLSTFNTVPPRHTHMVALIPALALLTAIGVQIIANGAAATVKKLRGFRVVLLAFLLALIGLGGLYDYFIKMPPVYRPHPDQIVLWTGLGVKDEALVYVYTNPVEKEFIPTMVQPFRPGILVEALSFEEFQSGARPFPVDQPTIVLSPPDIKDHVWATLMTSWGTNLIPKTFFSSNFTPVLAAGMNTPFVFERDKLLTTILKDSYSHVSLLILLVVLGALAALAAFLPPGWTLKFPAPVKRLTNWLSVPEGGANGKYPTAMEEEEFEWPEEPPLEDTPEPGAQEPPEWAQEVFEAAEPQEGKRVQIQARRIKKAEHSELYLKISLPHLHVPMPKLPWSKQASDTPEISLPPLRIPDAPLLISAFGAAIMAQILIHFQLGWMGAAAYLVSLGVLLYWAKRNPKWRAVFERQLQITPQFEKLALLALMLVMAYIRFYDLGFRVYGLEADETKWTVQSWFSTILGIDRGEFHGMHYLHVPVDFWVRSMFLRLFGLDFLSARIESAVLSLISIVFLFLLVRLLTGSAASAFLSALLFGFSFYELNASHQALHNTPIQPWIMSSLFFLIWSIRDRKRWKFQVTGILLALGMLTYETFYPTALLAILYLLGWAVYELARRRESFRNWLTNLLLATWPVIVVYFGFVRDYMEGRQYYLFGWLWDTAAGKTGQSVPAFILNNITNLLTSTFSRITHIDSLLNWDGPLISPLLLPFIVIGLAYNLWNIRRRHFVFILLWYLIQILPGPVITGSTWPRVMYTALGPLMIWGALGLWTSLAALRAWFDQVSPRLARLAFLALAIAIFTNNYSIFASQLTDSTERQRRRELADLTAEAARDAQLLLLPYIPFMGDPVEVESHVILFSVASVKRNELSAENYFKQIEYENLLSTLWENRDVPGIAILVDKSIDQGREERQQVLQVTLGCYPQASLKTSGRFFDIYELSLLALNQPACYHPPAPGLTNPQDEDRIREGTPIYFTWDTHGVLSTSFALTLERKLEDVFWLEAETEFIGAGWHPEAAFAEGFSGDGFLLDDWQAGTATHTFHAPSEGAYRVWVRAYKRVDNDQHNYLSLAGQTVEFAENGSPANEWVWRDLGVYNLPAGPAPISLSRAYGNDEQYAVFIDAVLITPNLAFEPGKDTIWQPALNTGETASGDPAYTIPESLPPGEYRWRVRIFDGGRLVDPSGERGVLSPVATFFIKPDVP